GLESGAGPIFERDGAIIQIDPDETAELHFATQAAQARAFFAQAVLIAFFLARDINAIAFHVELPGMKQAGNPLRVSGRLPFQKAAGRTALKQIATMRADIEERANDIIRTA